MLSLDVQKQLGKIAIDARFALGGSAAALFGPSGAGKSSIINIIAGLLKPDRGKITIQDEIVFDSAARIDVPAHKRNVGYVFQEGRLFPHLTVRSNLNYGRRMHGRASKSGEEDRIVAMLDLAPLLERRPGRLSGGERQRVAIGRALMMQPRLLLLDEPLSSLDATRKAEIFPYFERLRDEAGVPLLYVSHHPDEIRRMAAQVVLVEAGRAVDVVDAETLR
jgi:molybdate transport system ATP-binding protein